MGLIRSRMNSSSVFKAGFVTVSNSMHTDMKMISFKTRKMIAAVCDGRMTLNPQSQTSFILFGEPNRRVWLWVRRRGWSPISFPINRPMIGNNATVPFLPSSNWQIESLVQIDCSIVIIIFSFWCIRGRDWIFHSCLSRPLTCSSSKVVLIQFTSCRPLPLPLRWLITVQTRGELTFSHATTAKLWSTVLVWCQSGLEDSWVLFTCVEHNCNESIYFSFTIPIHQSL